MEENAGVLTHESLSVFLVESLAIYAVPRKLPRLIPLSAVGDTIDYVFLHDVITHHARNLYRGYEVVSSGAFRVTRNSNLYLHEEESRNLLESVDTQLHHRLSFWSTAGVVNEAVCRSVRT